MQAVTSETAPGAARSRSDGEAGSGLQRRGDTGQWALPGEAQDVGETAAQCAIRECLEETGIRAEITGFLAVLHQPNFIGRSIGGEPTINDEADSVLSVLPADLEQYVIHPSMRQQIADNLVGTYLYLG